MKIDKYANERVEIKCRYLEYIYSGTNFYLIIRLIVQPTKICKIINIPTLFTINLQLGFKNRVYERVVF